MMNEEWKLIPFTHGFYSASSFGRIKSNGLDRMKRKPTILKPTDNGTYLMLTVYVKGKRVQKHVSFLVADAFLGPLPDGKTINHIDFDSRNNCPGNMEYITQRENNYHTVKARRHAHHDTHGCAKLNSVQVARIREIGVIGWHGNVRALAAEYGVSKDTITRVIHKQYWKDEPHYAVEKS